MEVGEVQRGAVQEEREGARHFAPLGLHSPNRASPRRLLGAFEGPRGPWPPYPSGGSLQQSFAHVFKTATTIST